MEPFTRFRRQIKSRLLQRKLQFCILKLAIRSSVCAFACLFLEQDRRRSLMFEGTARHSRLSPSKRRSSEQRNSPELMSWTALHPEAAYTWREPRGSAMKMRIATIGLDIAKSVFQVHGADAAGQVVVRRRLTRGRVLAH